MDRCCSAVTLKTKDIVDKFADLPDGQRQGIVADALAATAAMKWLPLLAQTQAAIEAVEAVMRESLTPG